MADGRVICGNYAIRNDRRMDIVPMSIAVTAPMGLGRRSEPNLHPYLPEPNGRLLFTMNPFYVLSPVVDISRLTNIIF
jgi:hypothetical protein